MPEEKYTDALMDEMRKFGDPPADGAIEALSNVHQLQAVQKMLDQMITNDAVTPENIPTEVATFWEESRSLANSAAGVIAEGEVFFAEHGPEIMLVLGFYSLPMDYAARGVRVLYDTGYLVTHPNRRLLETMQMVIDVMSPGGLACEGKGITTALKVRLMHAAIRYLLLHGQGSVASSGDPPRTYTYPIWDSSLGLPINQEDMAGTLMSFSFLVLDGLRKLGIDVSSTEELAFLRAWRVVGTILGVNSKVIPETMEEASELTELIISRQIRPSQESCLMTAKLLEMYQKNVTGPIFRGVPAALMRRFLPKDMADKLGVPKNLFYDVLVRVVGTITVYANQFLKVGIDRTLYRRFSIRFLQFMINMNRGVRPNFAIPTQLDKDWRVSPQFRPITTIGRMKRSLSRLGQFRHIQPPPSDPPSPPTAPSDPPKLI
jgi:hypothetical protein